MLLALSVLLALLPPGLSLLPLRFHSAAALAGWPCSLAWLLPSCLPLAALLLHILAIAVAIVIALLLLLLLLLLCRMLLNNNKCFAIAIVCHTPHVRFAPFTPANLVLYAGSGLL